MSTTPDEPEQVSFRSGGATCAAWLYRPGPPHDRRVPVVVMAHGFAGTARMRLPTVAQPFAAAGLGVLLFDYRHFGASKGSPRLLVDLRSQRADYRAAIAFARSLAWVDPERVALFGTSLSAGHALAVAASDRRIAAVVAQAPFTDGLASVLATPIRSVLKAGLAALVDSLGALLGRPPRYLAVTGPPGSAAVLTTADASSGYAAIAADDPDWENRVAARVALRLPAYRPGRRARTVRCPILFCVCEHDLLAPARPTLRHAAQAPAGTVQRYPIGHFDIYAPPWSGRAVDDQTRFLARHLLGDRP